MAFDESGIVGHFIMRYTNGDIRNLRLGWVIVDDSRRGRGYGRRMLELGLEYAFKILKARRVSIGVFENNEPAYKCYKSRGFTEAKQDTYRTSAFKGKEWRVIELEKFSL